MHRSKLLLLFLFVISGSLAQAGDLAILTDRTIYEATYDACSKLPEEKLREDDLDFDKIYAGIFPSQKFNELLAKVSSESLDNALVHFQYSKQADSAVIILNNAGFDQALQDCYGSSTYPRFIFTRAVSRFDRNGKIFAGVTTVVVFCGIGAVLAKIRQWSKTVSYAIGTTMMSTYVYFLYEDIKESLHLKKVKADICQAKGLSPGECLVAASRANAENDKAKAEEAILAKQILLAKVAEEKQTLETQISQTVDPEEKGRLEKVLREYAEIH